MNGRVQRSKGFDLGADGVNKVPSLIPSLKRSSTVRKALPNQQVNAMTIDVEDYYQISAFDRYIDRDQWPNMEGRVSATTDKILQMLDDADVKATFFTLGCVADRYPSIVKRIVEGKHELASHGWGHDRVNMLDQHTFSNDVRQAKQLLEDLSGQAVTGYRAPSYSINKETPWAHQVLCDAGYQYSSSIAPIKHDLYGMPGASRFPFAVCDDKMLEIPITTTEIFGKNIACGGGGWFRLYPYQLSRYFLSRVNKQDGKPTVFYCHPWEFDDNIPRQHNIDAKTRFRTYINIGKMPSRFQTLLKDFRWDRMDSVFADELNGLSSNATLAES